MLQYYLGKLVEETIARSAIRCKVISLKLFTVYGSVVGLAKMSQSTPIFWVVSKSESVDSTRLEIGLWNQSFKGHVMWSWSSWSLWITHITHKKRLLNPSHVVVDYKGARLMDRRFWQSKIDQVTRLTNLPHPSITWDTNWFSGNMIN